MRECNKCGKDRPHCTCDLDYIERTNLPSLGSLFKTARERGLISPAREYTS